MECKKCKAKKEISVVLGIINVNIMNDNKTFTILIDNFSTGKEIQIKINRDPEIFGGAYKLLQTKGFKNVYGNKVFTYSIRNKDYKYNLYLDEPIEWDTTYTDFAEHNRFINGKRVFLIHL